MTNPRHLVAVWNPAYASDAMDAHLATLLEWAAKGDPEETYVWWGKLRSANRQQPLPHTADVLALHEQIEQEIETHLYLTDYRSLYVAHLDEVTADDTLATMAVLQDLPLQGNGKSPAGGKGRQPACLV